MLIELPGILVTLTVCFLGLWRTSRGRPGWLVALLLGASLPLLVSIAILLFFEASDARLARVVGLDEFPTANIALVATAAVIPALAPLRRRPTLSLCRGRHRRADRLLHFLHWALREPRRRLDTLPFFPMASNCSLGDNRWRT
jgi:hypothetical protein